MSIVVFESEHLTLEQIRARQLLRTMDKCDYFAHRAADVDISESQRRRSFEFYKRMVGVPPSVRAKVRQQLCEVLGARRSDSGRA